MVGLEKKSLDLGFENFVGGVSPPCFGIVVRTHSRLLYSFLTQFFLQIAVRKKEYMELNVRNVVGNMARGYCIPIDSMKS